MATLEDIKALREKTGAGIVDVKKALEEAGGQEEKAIEILRKKGKDKAIKKSDRETKEGVIGVYIHANKKIGAMVKLCCETDFVARNIDFQILAQDIAMHVTAMSPTVVTPEEVSEEIVAKEREIWTEQLASEGKSEEIMKKILEGKEQKFRGESALLSQAFVKNPEITIEELVAEKIGVIGEKISISEFVRYEL
ncbi:MAG: elongation factor Ts [Candidatus Moranbacteria bacterium]|nr:elongation factor Ts [Candidatus Moranbacteria bacterium]